MNTKVSPYSSDELIADIGSYVVNGWYFDKEKAENIIINNVTDIWETCYDYAILEECNEGMYDFDRVKTYYKYNRKTDRYDKMSTDDIPKAFLCPTFSVSRIGM